MSCKKPGPNLSSGGAHERDRTADLVLTKDVLYQLSYVGGRSLINALARQPLPARQPRWSG
jgi:hypothetical protein